LPAPSSRRDGASDWRPAMYSLGLRNQQEQAKRSQEAIERRHAKPADGARRDHHLLQVYGKTHAEMMSSGQQRREVLPMRLGVQRAPVRL